MLVDAMAGVSEQDQDGLTALMNAAEIGAGEIVTYLLNKGWDFRRHAFSFISFRDVLVRHEWCPDLQYVGEEATDSFSVAYMVEQYSSTW